MEAEACMTRNTEDFMRLWRCAKPNIEQVHGAALAGGSDIALRCNLLVIADDARIAHMHNHVWGCPSTAPWNYRLGPAGRHQTIHAHRQRD